VSAQRATAPVPPSFSSLSPAKVLVSISPPPRNFELAFGSCNRSTLPQPLWSTIALRKPNAFAWLGDIIYADTEDMPFMRLLYAQQAGSADYAAFAARVPVVGTWDDHDYGQNDAGKQYPKRRESQAALLDFLNEPRESARRRREGVYVSYVFGAEERSIKLILLDLRYHRELPGADADTLGAAQWAWLARELAESTAALTLIASSFQILPEDHGSESWAHFPAARARLLRLIAAAGSPGVVLLSGDRHFAELSMLEDPEIGYPLFELTSSGMTHSWFNIGHEPNRHRIGALYPLLNFGSVSVDFEQQSVTLAAYGQDGQAAISHTVPLARLVPSELAPEPPLGAR